MQLLKGLGLPALTAAAIAALAIAGIESAAPVSAAPVVTQVHYVGIHPIPKAAGGGICYIEGPHVHIYEADKLQYRDHHGAHYFVGDPVAYGFDGKHYAYKGPHIIHVDMVLADDQPDEEFCYLEGPHFHYFAPPDTPEFELRGDAYFYVGEPPKVFVDARPALVKINAVYTPIVYERPVITVEPPSAWIGLRAEFMTPAVVVEAPRAQAAAGVIVAPPSVSIKAVMPSVHIGVGVGVSAGVGVGVGGGVRVRHGHR